MSLLKKRQLSIFYSSLAGAEDRENVAELASTRRIGCNE